MAARDVLQTTPGVALAEKYIARFTEWRRPDGGEENIEIVGFNPDSGIGGPWNLTAGNVRDLKMSNTAFIDESYQDKLGVTYLGQVVEIRGHRARVAGFTQGIRSFTTSPFVFTSFKNALDYAQLKEDQTIYILVRAAAGVEPQALKQRLATRISGVDIYTTAEFSRKTQSYWMFGTGAGIALLVAALMGLIVGVVVVAQTIYATTVDHLREFGTLKAMGASNRYICLVIIKQGVISAVIGYALCMPVSLLVVHLSRRSGAMIVLPWELAVSVFGIALVMCISASLISINKVTRIDPALVFKA